MYEYHKWFTWIPWVFLASFHKHLLPRRCDEPRLYKVVAATIFFGGVGVKGAHWLESGANELMRPKCTIGYYINPMLDN